jgi:hypothetical protein
MLRQFLETSFRYLTSSNIGITDKENFHFVLIVLPPKICTQWRVRCSAWLASITRSRCLTLSIDGDGDAGQQRA